MLVEQPGWGDGLWFAVDGSVERQTMPAKHNLWRIPVGFAVGAYGTLIGAGGGFVLVPFLLLFYPGEDPEVLTSISLAVALGLVGICVLALAFEAPGN